MKDRNVKREEMKFKFHDSRTVQLKTVVHLPGQLEDRIFNLKAHVLPGRVPFLIEIETMRKMRASLDILNSNKELLGTKLNGKMNEMGHIVLNLQIAEGKHDGRSIRVFHITNKNNTEVNFKQFLNTLHVKIGHASSNKLSRVVENSSISKDLTKSDIKKLVELINYECAICHEADRGDPKNCSLRATDFNESVAIDLTEWW